MARWFASSLSLHTDSGPTTFNGTYSLIIFPVDALHSRTDLPQIVTNRCVASLYMATDGVSFVFVVLAEKIWSLMPPAIRLHDGSQHTNDLQHRRNRDTANSVSCDVPET